jgi:hypothetical protein
MEFIVALAVAVATAVPAQGQVEASQPTKEQIQEMTGAPKELCPLLLEIDLARTEHKKAIVDLPTPGSWLQNRGLREYVCDLGTGSVRYA